MSAVRLRWVLLLSALVMAAAGATAQVRLGSVSVSAGYSYFSRLYYDPFWWDRYGYPFGPMFFAPVQGRPVGEVQIDAPEKQADVYIEGGYAGKAGKLKKLWLDPGVYSIELRVAGRQPEERRVYVLSNKTVKLVFGKATP